jgi:hypothetical protein
LAENTTPGLGHEYIAKFPTHVAKQLFIPQVQIWASECEDYAVFTLTELDFQGDRMMAQRRQRGWLKTESRTHGDTWVLFFRKTRKSDGKRIENKIPIGLFKDFPEKNQAWAEVERLHLSINELNSRRGITFGGSGAALR